MNLPQTHRQARRPAPSLPEIVAGAGARYLRLNVMGTGSTPPDPPPSGGTGTLEINVLGGSGNLFAPYHLYLRADNFAGFAVQDIAPDDLGYDPTQHDIQYAWFGLADQGYVPTQTPNLPNMFRKPWEASGRQVAGCWMLPGTKEVTVFAYDNAGTWGFASITRTIEGEDALYPGDLTICVSATGSAVGAPAGAQITTTLADAYTRAIAIRNRADTAMRRPRILLNRGEIFAAPSWEFGNWGSSNASTVSLTIGAYGNGARPVLDYAAGGQIQFMNQNPNAPRHVIRDIEFRGPWRAWEDVGELRSTFGDGSANNIRNHVLFARCLFTGLDGVYLGGDAPDNATGGVMLFDCEITNWCNYGLGFTNPRTAHIWCDYHQHEDALNGVPQGTGDQRPTQLGSRHGPFRGGRNEGFINACSMFSRNGWSNSSNPESYVSWSPTAIQAAMRWNQPASERRTYNNICQSSFEGGINVVAISGGVTSGNIIPASTGMHIDRILVVANWGTTGASFGDPFAPTVRAMTVRNAFLWFPNVPMQHNALIEQSIRIDIPGLEVVMHNCTALNQQPTSRLASNFVNVSATGSGVVVLDNNVFRVAGRSIGAGLEPLGTSPFAGFACRDKGARWNFRPAIHNVSSVREGGPGDVLPGEWVSIPYPNHTGQNNGAGAQVTRAMVEQPTRRHVVSVNEGGAANGGGRQNMTSLSAGGNGRVNFAYTDTHIRVRNDGLGRWRGTDTIFVLLDLFDRLMTFVPGTSTEGLVPPMPVPGVGSSARGTATSGRRALSDIAGTRRPGTRTNNGTAIPGTASQGAFEPA